MPESRRSDSDKVLHPQETQELVGDERPVEGATKPGEPGYGKITAKPSEHVSEPTRVEVNIPNAYEQYCHRIHGRSDADFVREQYEKDYPVVNPDRETEHDRRGMPDGHDDQGNPTYQNGVPPGVKLEMMHSSLVPTKTMASYTYSHTPGHEPWEKGVGEAREAKGDPKAAGLNDPRQEDNNNDPITGGLGHGLVSWPPKRTPNPYGYHYTEGDGWQHAGDTCAAKRRCGGGGFNHDQSPGSGADPSNTQSQINSRFN